ncbi:HesA/MoeB/ThiF family protein [Brevundimonas sp.]|uniref:HesA/MoeB/ThiF family protein n=1 Tax=Brevundimonas sp. TaxID=1871086 RepID=UPI003D117338
MSWLDRQSFLGVDSDAVLAGLTVGLVGLGGGNSHVAQQLAHLGVGGYVLVDDDLISLTNLNRLVGATFADIIAKRSKLEISKRVILGVNPQARISGHQARWQVVGDALKGCDLIIGGVDNIRSKDELEAFCRRFMIPYIDMGMDVHQLAATGEYLVAGQVVLSSPGEPCLRCLGVITDEALEAEAKRYGDAGSKPQVVWPNGVLASTAVGLLVQMVTPWHRAPIRSAYLAYDANLGTVAPSDRLRRRLGKTCPHYPPKAVGDPGFDIRRFLEAQDAAITAKTEPTIEPVRRLNWFDTLTRWFKALY